MNPVTGFDDPGTRLAKHPNIKPTKFGGAFGHHDATPPEAHLGRWRRLLHHPMRAGLGRHGSQGLVSPGEHPYGHQRARPEGVLLETREGLRHGGLEMYEPQLMGGPSEVGKMIGERSEGCLVSRRDAEQLC
jgi:hypothetical protein